MSNEKNFEEKLLRLDEILSKFDNIADMPLSLDDALSLYDEGMQLIQDCTVTLENAQKRIKERSSFDEE